MNLRDSVSVCTERPVKVRMEICTPAIKRHYDHTLSVQSVLYPSSVRKTSIVLTSICKNIPRHCSGWRHTFVIINTGPALYVESVCSKYKTLCINPPLKLVPSQPICIQFAKIYHDPSFKKIKSDCIPRFALLDPREERICCELK